MHRPLRLLLVWILAIALPLKGAAAIAMTLCGPAHHGGGSSRVHGHAAVDGHVARHAPDISHRAAASGAAHAISHAAAPADGDSEYGAPELSSNESGGAASDKAADPHSSKCSACAPCCAAAAPGVEAPGVPQLEVARDSDGFYAGRYAGVVVALPDRPPRSLLV